MSDAAARRWQGVAVASAALYGLLLFALRPATPYEWDEVLFLKGLDSYDVARHAPHPPGYPVYMAAGKLVRWAVRDPLLTLEIVSIAAALAALWLLWRTARDLKVPPLPAFGSAAILAVAPAFAFNANVGLSDVPGTAAATGALLCLVRARRDERLLPLAAGVTALALGVRPQLLLAVLIPGLLVLWPAVRAKRWKDLLLATGTGVGVLLACWIPAVLVTGRARFVSAVALQAKWTEVHEAGYHLPEAPIGKVFDQWLNFPFGSKEMAIAFWLLVVLGTIAWLRRGDGALVGMAAGSGFGYLVPATFTMNMTTSVRYIVPALPALALLAAGVLVAPWRPLRRAGAVMVVLWCGAVVGWGAPVYALRRQPAPCWEALQWVGQHFPPDTTTVLYQGLLEPHAPYLLKPRGFKPVAAEDAEKVEIDLRRPRTVLNVGPLVPDGAEVMFSRDWRSGRLRRLTRDRYNLCAVSRVRALESTAPLAGWRSVARPPEALEKGEVPVVQRSRPTVVRLCASADPARVLASGQRLVPLSPWSCADFAVLTSWRSNLVFTDSAGRPSSSARTYELPFGELAFQCRPSHELVVPQVARLTGRGGAAWRTDLVVVNPSDRPVHLSARLLWSRASASPVDVPVDIAAGGALVVPDVLGRPEFGGRTGVGALLVRSLDRGRPCRRSDCAFQIWACTYNASARSVGWHPEEWLPGVAPEEGLREGRRATFSSIRNDAAVRASVGVASLSGGLVRVRVRAFNPAGAVVEDSQHTLGGFGHVHAALMAELAGGRVEVEALEAPRDAVIFPYVSLVNAASGAVKQLLPDDLRASEAETRATARPQGEPVPR